MDSGVGAGLVDGFMGALLWSEVRLDDGFGSVSVLAVAHKKVRARNSKGGGLPSRPNFRSRGEAWGQEAGSSLDE